MTQDARNLMAKSLAEWRNQAAICRASGYYALAACADVEIARLSSLLAA